MAAPKAIVPYEEWMKIHLTFFQEYHFPLEPLAPILYQKLLNNIMDAGQFFAIDTSGDPTLLYNPPEEALMVAYSDVFFTDHVWSPDPMKIDNEWKALPELRERLAAYTSYSKPEIATLSLEERLNKCDGKNLDLDELEIKSLAPLQIPTRFSNLETLSLWGNHLSDKNDLISTVSQLKNLRALWINGNSVVADEEQKHQIEKEILSLNPQIEILNSIFTPNYTSWALGFVSKSVDDHAVVVMDLSDRGITELKVDAFKPFKNLQKVNFCGNPVSLSNVLTIIPNLHSIYVDDEKLSELPEGIIFFNGKTKTGEQSLPVPGRIWDHVQPAGDRWGVGDEIALAIHHSTTPNFAAMPVGNPANGLTYFAFWPIEDIQPLSDVTANLFPQLPFGNLEDALKPKQLTPMVSLKSKFKSTVTTKSKIKVFTDIDIFAENLHSDRFEVVKNQAEADLYWIGFTSITDFQPIYNNKILLNQIENENCLTVKDLLYETVTRFMGAVPWLPETFILSEGNDVTAFLYKNDYLKEHSQSHAWVVKAFNQSRANFMIVTEEPSEALRHASLSPRIAQRYLWNPLNIFGLKFDLRFIVLLKSVKPMELYAYKVFWPRMAPKEWALDDFDDYERHFTVMNYRAPDKVTHKTWVDFVEQFGKENPNVRWEDVLQNCYKAIRDMFVCGCQIMVPTPYTKAMYGIDLMITNEYQPVILECNFQPDCKRACNLCPTFVDDVFEVLFTQQPVTCDKVAYIPLD